MKNLKYISSLREKGELTYLKFNFVVQLDNYKEMKNFVKLAKKYSVDEVGFQRMSNWGTVPQLGFSKIDVFDSQNVYYDEASSMLEEIKKDNEIKISENCL